MISRFYIVVAAVLFSTGGAAVKACALSSWQIASFRSGLAALTVFILIPEARRRWTWSTWAVGFVYATTLVLYVLANKLTTAANTIFLQGSAPLYVLLLSPLLLGEKNRSRDIVFMIGIGIGAFLLFAGEQPTFITAPDPVRGNILAACAGLAWGLTIMGLRWLSREGGKETGTSTGAVVCGNIIAFVVVLPFALPAQIAAIDVFSVTYLGVFQVGIAYIFLTKGIKAVSALEVSLLLLVEPVLNPLWAFLMHGELQTRFAALGSAIIIGATALKAWLDGRRSKIYSMDEKSDS